MTLWEEFKTDVRNAADFTVKKTEELTDSAKKKLAVHNCESDLRHAYEKLGRVYYISRDSVEDKQAKLDEAVASIRELEAKLASLKSEA